MSRSIFFVVLLGLLSGCAAIDSGSHRAERALTTIGHSIEEGAESARRKTLTFWQRLFGSGASSAPSRKKTPATAGGEASGSGEPAKFDTYAQEKVGG